LKILILGGYGRTGRSLTRHLLRHTAHHVIVAGRHLEKAQALANQLAHRRVSALQADARDPLSLKRALRSVELLLDAAPTTHDTESVVTCALQAGVDCLDLQLSSRKLEILEAHEKDIRRKGLCFVTEAGFHPGLPSAMVRYGATRMQTVYSAYTAGYLNVGRDLPYAEAVDELMGAFVEYPAQVFKAGRWTRPGAFDVRKFDFGAGIGRRACYSMFFEELRSLPEMIPALKDAGFYIASTGWLPDTVAMVVLLGLRVAPRRGIRPLGKLMWWAMTKLSSAPFGVVLQLECSGQVQGRVSRLRLRLAHPDAYEFTAIPVVAFLLQYPKIRCPGLHMMGHLCNPSRLMTDMQDMGIKAYESVE
jgi:saccharopine dehydrogenase (NAD+, L-lysine-forming)